MAPKPRWASRRRHMTLIAAIPCQHGVVLAADTQETVSVCNGHEWVEYRRTIQKIVPRDMGGFSVVVAGTGNAALIDSFILVLERKLATVSGVALTDFVSSTEDALSDFYGTDVALWPDENDRFVKMIFAAAPKIGGDSGVWLQKHIRLSPLVAPELVGVEESLYDNTLKRVCGDGPAVQQGILAALYVLTMAEQTSNSVRAPMTVVVIRPNGIWPEREEYVETMTERLRAYEKHLSAIFMACADTSVSPKTLEKQLNEFASNAISLHTAQIQRVAQMQIDEGLYIVNDSHPRLPPGTVLSIPETGPVTVEFDVLRPAWMNRSDRTDEMHRKLEEWKAEQATPPSTPETS
jgi:hypothetical protein